MRQAVYPDVVIIGGGAAGMIAALFASRAGAEVVLLERNKRLGVKLGITGKGRCNVTNDCSVPELVENVPGNGRFLFSAFSYLDSQKTMALFTELGVGLKVERGNRVFPESDRAGDLIEALRVALAQSGVSIRYGCRVEKISRLTTDGFAISGRGFSTTGRTLVIASGGMSYPATGSSGDGYDLAKSLGHNITPPKPALVPLETRETWVRDVQGLSLRNVTLSSSVGEEFGEMLFTHYGISGPLVLTLSRHMVPTLTKGPLPISIDLKPALSNEKLEARLLRDFAEFSRRQFSNSLAKLLPTSLIPTFVTLTGIDPAKPVHQVTREERERVVSLLKCLPLTVVKPRPMEEAIITAGGVRTSELNPGTLESKLIPGLFFCGEIIDVDGLTGGYNLQIAWSTGALAGTSAAHKEK